MPRRLKLVINHEEQYRLLREDQDLPAGYKDAGKRGSNAELREEAMRLLAERRREQRAETLEELLDEEDRTTSTASEHLPRR